MRPARLLLFLLFPIALNAASLPSGLVPTEIEGVVRILGFPAVTRLLRSAEAYKPWPGIKVGGEVTISSTQDLATLGDKNGSVPQFTLLPRLYLSKGLFSELELILSTFPIRDPVGVATIGGILKWTFYQEKETWLSAAAYFGYTRVYAFHSDYVGNDVEFGIYFSKDWVRLKPFLGAAMLFAEGSVRPVLAKTAATSALQSTLHTFLGAEWEFPLNLGFQVDLMNLTPMGSLFIGKKF